MRTRRSPRNQERLFRILFPKPPMPTPIAPAPPAPFNPKRLALLRAAYVRELDAEIAKDPASFKTLSGTVATGEGIALRMFTTIANRNDCGAVQFLQSKAMGRAARSLGVKFTIKACNAWLRGADA